MIGHELAIEQGETAIFHARDEMSKRDFGRVGYAREHALSEKDAAQPHTI